MKFVTNVESHQKVIASSNMRKADLTQCSFRTPIVLKYLSMLNVQAFALFGSVVPLNTFAPFFMNFSRVETPPENFAHGLGQPEGQSVVQ